MSVGIVYENTNYASLSLPQRIPIQRWAGRPWDCSVCIYTAQPKTAIAQLVSVLGPNRWKARFSLWTSSVFLFVLFTDRSIPPNNMCTVYCTVYSYSCGRKNVFYSALPRTALSLTQCCSGQHSADLPEAINVTHVILKSTDSTTNGNISANSLNRFLSYKRKPHVTELSKHLGTL